MGNQCCTGQQQDTLRPEFIESHVTIKNINNEWLHVYGVAALEKNQTATSLTLLDEGSKVDVVDSHDFYDVPIALILKFVERSKTLKRIKCKEIRSTILVQKFLKAVTANSNIKEVELYKIPMLAEMTKLLLQESKSIKKLDISATMKQVLHVAIQSETIIQTFLQDTAANTNKEVAQVKLLGIDNGTQITYRLDLEKKTTVTALDILGDENKNHVVNDSTDVELLLNYMEASTTLKRVRCNVRSESRESRDLSFIQAVVANSNIEEVSFDGIPVPAMLQLLLQESTSVKRIEMQGHDNYSFQTSGGKYKDNLDWWIPALHQNKCLECLKMECLYFQTNSFRILAEAIKQSTSMKSIQFFQCKFQDSSADDLLELVCGERSNIQELAIPECTFQNIDKTSFCLTVIETRAHTANLRKLHVDLEDVNVVDLLRPFQKYSESPIPLLNSIILCGVYQFQKRLQLLQNLPSLRGLEELEFWAPKEFLENIEKVMRRTSCLKSLVTRDIYSGNIVENDTLKQLGMRNEMVHHWRYESQQPIINKKYMNRVLTNCLHYKFQQEVIFDLLKKHWALLDSQTKSKRRCRSTRN